MKPYQFQWVIQGTVAVSGQPMSKEEYLYLTKDEGIQWAINLREYPVETYFKKYKKWEHDFDLEYYHIATKDGHGFTIGKFEELYNIYELADERGKKLLIHCAGGMGRTSTALIGILMKSENLTYEEILTLYQPVRRILGYTDIQESSLKEWQDHLINIVEI